MSSELDFGDLSLIEVPFTINGVEYILREASEKAAVTYRNKMLACTRLGPQGKPQSMAGMASTEPLLVSLCAFHKEGNKPVPIALVESWPTRVVKKLFDKAKAISELDQEDTQESIEKEIQGLQERLARMQADAAGNEPEATDGT